ncbi:nuclear transport factor 2 family protein [Tomitella biformata]|uniref:nuclear transport factor 2 family protein n=1 Tax=Tomitella biformata TaxID=630403 RepID=UPI00046696E9|nr:nuclear transport factor 2 family protein [Tomitella biformata]
MFDFNLLLNELDKPRLRQPLPEFLPSNRGVQARVIAEDELNKMHREFFVELKRQIDFLGGHGIDIGWLYDWAAKYTWSWLARDMSRNDEIYTQDLRYVDPTTFGRTIVGQEEFVKYNFAFLDAISDWRYDPFPDQFYIDVTADGETRLVIRYMGSGYFDGTLRLYPYDDTAPALTGAGNFVQACAVDRYHFSPDGLMCFGETLWDFMDMAQSAGIAPRDDSWQFKALMQAARLPALGNRLRRRVPFL